MANSISIGAAYLDQAISGGTVDNTPIGATTRSTIKCTTLDANGNVALGDAAGDLIGFHGVTAVAQAAFVATVSNVYLEASVSASAIVGFSKGQFSNMIVLLDAIQNVLRDKGFMASS